MRTLCHGRSIECTYLTSNRRASSPYRLFCPRDVHSSKLNAGRSMSLPRRLLRWLKSCKTLPALSVEYMTDAWFDSGAPSITTWQGQIRSHQACRDHILVHHFKQALEFARAHAWLAPAHLLGLLFSKTTSCHLSLTPCIVAMMRVENEVILPRDSRVHDDLVHKAFHAPMPNAFFDFLRYDSSAFHGALQRTLLSLHSSPATGRSTWSDLKHNFLQRDVFSIGS